VSEAATEALEDASRQESEAAAAALSEPVAAASLAQEDAAAKPDPDSKFAFVPAEKFEGPKPGFVFRTGPEGTGYYNRDYVWKNKQDWIYT